MRRLLNAICEALEAYAEAQRLMTLEQEFVDWFAEDED